MRHFLLWTLYAPLASFGDVAVGGTRPSFSYPTKSSIVGMLAAALGLRREQSSAIEELAGSLGYAVRVERGGERFEDFHTVQTPKQKILNDNTWIATRKDALHPIHKSNDGVATILSTREYVQNGIYSVCVWLKEETAPYSLESLANALQSPVFTLYLGRKSCPLALPLKPFHCETLTLTDAMRQYNEKAHPLAIIHREYGAEKKSLIAKCWDVLQKKPSIFDDFSPDNSPQQHYVYWDASLPSHEVGFSTTSFQQKRRDEPRSRTKWQFGERFEYSAILDEPASPEAQHD
jgi:CRISPR system Cascade subunit CasD